MLTNAPNVTPQFIQALFDTIVLCLEMVFLTMEQSPTPNEYGRLPANLEELIAGTGGSCDRPERNSKGPWSVVFFSDEKHTAQEIVRQTRDALGVLQPVAQHRVREAEETVSPAPPARF